jgi:hypothetical protein
VEFLAQVQLSKADEVHIMSTVNVSRGGVFLSATLPEIRTVTPGMTAELLIFAPEEIQEDVELTARVVRVRRTPIPTEPTGLAMEFVDVDQANATRLQKLLAPKRTP